MHTLSDVFSKYSAWNILLWFIENPSKEIHVKQLSRELRISSSTASNILKELNKTGMLNKEKRANVLFYCLNNDNPISNQFKRLNTIMKIENFSLVDFFIEDDDAIITIAIYGSYASGENDQKSDMDILLITGSKRKDYEKALHRIQELFGCKPSLLKLSLTSWRRLKDKDPIFYESVIGNHLILWGSQLP